jgi:hypothetical protein
MIKNILVVDFLSILIVFELTADVEIICVQPCLFQRNNCLPGFLSFF